MGSTARRHFRVEEANELLREVRGLMQAASVALQTRAKAKGDLLNYRRRLVLSGGVVPNANRMGAYEDQAKVAHRELSAVVNQLEEMGLEVRDLEQGMVDFPSYFQGRSVYLCYRLGEAEVSYWHEIEEKFSARRRIDEIFLAQHHGEEPSGQQ